MVVILQVWTDLAPHFLRILLFLSFRSEDRIETMLAVNCSLSFSADFL